MMRLNRFIAQSGRWSRRQADSLIERGVVTINGVPVDKLGTVIDETDLALDVRVHDQRVEPRMIKHTTVMFNKPSGVVVTKANYPGERNITSVLPDSLKQLKAVGSLGRDCEGLLLLTSDGDLQLRLTHPKFQLDKEYQVGVREPLTEADLAQLRRGVDLEEGNTGPHHITQIDEHTFTIIIFHSWRRQIRRMVATLGKHVNALQRFRVGQLRLGNLPVGKWQAVNVADILPEFKPQSE